MSSIDRQKEKWDVIKSKGKKSYILTYGVLPSIVFSLFLATFRIFFINKTVLHSTYDIILAYIIHLVSWSLIGILFGNKSWYNNVKKFEK